MKPTVIVQNPTFGLVAHGYKTAGYDVLGYLPGKHTHVTAVKANCNLKDVSGEKARPSLVHITIDWSSPTLEELCIEINRALSFKPKLIVIDARYDLVLPYLKGMFVAKAALNERDKVGVNASRHRVLTFIGKRLKDVQQAAQNVQQRTRASLETVKDVMQPGYRWKNIAAMKSARNRKHVSEAANLLGAGVVSMNGVLTKARGVDAVYPELSPNRSHLFFDGIKYRIVEPEDYRNALDVPEWFALGSFKKDTMRGLARGTDHKLAKHIGFKIKGLLK